MPLAPGIDFQLFYAGKNISTDVSDMLIDLNYTDNTGGHSDEAELTFNNVKKLWTNSWYPLKGDLINVHIGMDGRFLDCGDFKIDESQQKGPPHTFKIKGLSTTLKQSLRTRKWNVHENKTLKQIAQATCDAQGLTLDEGTHVVTLTKNVLLYSDEINTIRNQLFEGLELETTAEQQQLMFKLAPSVGQLVRDLRGDALTTQADQVDEGFRWTAHHISNSGFNYYIKRLLEVKNSLFVYRNNPNTQVLANNLSSIQVNRSAQAGETDLEYLLKISLQYGFTFNIKGTTMIFYMLGNLEDRPASASFKPSDLTSWDITTKTHGTYKNAKVRYQDWENQQVIESTAEAETSTDPDGDSGSEATSEDTLEIRERVENQQQADQMAKTELHNKNKNGCSATFDLPFNMLCCAGNVIELYDFGEDSGLFLITSASFTLSKQGGNTVSCTAHRVKFIAKERRNLAS